MSNMDIRDLSIGDWVCAEQLCGVNNEPRLTPPMKVVGFDIQEEEALIFSKGYKHLAGYITFFMAECPQCGCTMPFELDEGVCMKCNCDPADGIVEDMSEAELERVLHNNRYHLKLPYVRRQPFETLPQMLARQVEYRYNEAIKKYNYETTHNTRADRQTD